MVHMTVNGQAVTVPEGATLLQAVRAAKVELPTLCHHEGLAPSGACRLCMVVITAPHRALIASCAYAAQEGLVILTDAPEAVAGNNHQTGGEAKMIQLVLPAPPNKCFKTILQGYIIRERFIVPLPEF